MLVPGIGGSVGGRPGLGAEVDLIRLNFKKKQVINRPG